MTARKGKAGMAAILASRLRATLGVYICLVESGDAGNWDPHKESHVVDATVSLAEWDAMTQERSRQK